MPHRRLLPILCLLMPFVAPPLRAQVPQLINYQGRVAVNGTNFTGSGQFKFALVNSTGTTTYWSNDGSSANGLEPSSAVSLTVASGLYSVLLGDTSLPNMSPVPPGVFNNADVHLRVWFNDGSNGSQPLAPDQRIAAVGYAIIAGGVPAGAITSNMIASGAITSAKIDPATVQQRVSGSAPAGAFIQSVNADGSVVTAGVATGSGLSNSGGTISVDSSVPRLNTTNTFLSSNYFTGGNIGIGTTSASDALYVRPAPGSGIAGLTIQQRGSSADMSALTVRHVNPAGYGWRELATDTNGSFQLDRLFNGTWTSNALFLEASNGNFGIGTALPANRLTVAGNANFTGNVGIGNAAPGTALDVNGTATISGAVQTPTISALPVAGGAVQIVAGNSNVGTAGSVTVTAGTQTLTNAASAGDAILQGGSLSLFGSGSSFGASVRARGWTFPGTLPSGAGDLVLSGGSMNNLSGFGGLGGNVILNPGAGNAGTGSVLFQIAGTEKARIDSSGNVGIGTNTPGATLEVKVGGTTLADAWTVRSSGRWKANIRTIEHALQKVQQLRGVTFDWRDGRRGDLGLIAEEVGRVVPQVVTFEANGVDARSVDYQRLVAVLIEAVKEQQQDISALKQEVSNLRNAPVAAPVGTER